jgi:hypothetical protein
MGAQGCAARHDDHAAEQDQDVLMFTYRLLGNPIGLPRRAATAS